MTAGFTLTRGTAAPTNNSDVGLPAKEDLNIAGKEVTENMQGNDLNMEGKPVPEKMQGNDTELELLEKARELVKPSTSLVCGEVNQQLAGELNSRLSQLQGSQHPVECRHSSVFENVKHWEYNLATIDSRKQSGEFRTRLDTRSATMFNIDLHSYRSSNICIVDTLQAGFNVTSSDVNMTSYRALLSRRYSFDVRRLCTNVVRQPGMTHFFSTTDCQGRNVNILSRNNVADVPERTMDDNHEPLHDPIVQIPKWHGTKDTPNGLQNKEEQFVMMTAHVPLTILDVVQQGGRQDPLQAEELDKVPQQPSSPEEQPHAKTDRRRLFATSFRRRTHRTDTSTIFSPKLTASRRQAKHREKVTKIPP